MCEDVLMCKFMCLKDHSVTFLKRRICCHHLKIKSWIFSASYDVLVLLKNTYEIWTKCTKQLFGGMKQLLSPFYNPWNWVPPSPVIFFLQNHFLAATQGGWSPGWEWHSHWAEQTCISVWGSKAAENEEQAKLEKGDPWRMKPRILPGYFR